MEKIKSIALAFNGFTLLALLIGSLIGNYYFYQKCNQFFNDANVSMTKNKELTKQLSTQEQNVKQLKDSQKNTIDELTTEVTNLKDQVSAFAKQAAICDTVKQSLKLN